MDNTISGIANARYDRANQYSRSDFPCNRVARHSVATDQGRLVKNNLLRRVEGGVIEVREQVVLLVKRRHKINPQAIVQRQLASRLPAILREEFVIPVGSILNQQL